VSRRQEYVLLTVKTMNESNSVEPSIAEAASCLFSAYLRDTESKPIQLGLRSLLSDLN
jgi:hypothetical protein